jgi:hypothetical protein
MVYFQSTTRTTPKSLYHPYRIYPAVYNAHTPKKPIERVEHRVWCGKCGGQTTPAEFANEK